MGRYSKAFSIKKQFQSPNCQSCQGQSRTMKKFIFLELFLRIIEDEKWNLFEKLGQLRTPTWQSCCDSTLHSCPGCATYLLLSSSTHGSSPPVVSCNCDCLWLQLPPHCTWYKITETLYSVTKVALCVHTGWPPTRLLRMRLNTALLCVQWQWCTDPGRAPTHASHVYQILHYSHPPETL